MPASAASVSRRPRGGGVGQPRRGPVGRVLGSLGSPDGEAPERATDSDGEAPGRATGSGGEVSRHPLRAWAELLRISAPASVPGDLLAGAAAAGLRPNARTALAACSSLCLYEAGMALNDWADRDIDALERPHRPIPSGRISPGAALAAAGGLTAAGLACAAAAGRPALATATALAATVWAYDLHLKNTPAGPTAMACARALDLLQGAVATTGRGSGTSAGKDSGTSTGAGTAAGAAAGAGTGTGRGTAARTAGAPPLSASLRTAPTPRPHTRAALRALPSAALLGAHTFTVTTVSRREAQGSSSSLPLLALAAVTALANAAAGRRTTPSRNATRPSAQGNATPQPVQANATPPPAQTNAARPSAQGTAAPVPAQGKAIPPHVQGITTPPHVRRNAAPPLAQGGKAPTAGRRPTLPPATAFAPPLLAAGYAVTAARPLLVAALNPSPHFLQRAVGGGIRAMIPLQAALAARAGAPVTGAAVLALIPVARRLSRKVSPT
ncbi:SCO3242 family prenyltransferase [Streptomyces ochraceiscleroticus]|uniref:SCO3242 family prenyltransferase n=1 Tax=Streptomyces ochraceiscleroticus TaxID=47761 RepID=A0ABW1MT77_9ACTN|nr:UbiA family prenyltransferase [Streptomyces ochraceiscleroticus]